MTLKWERATWAGGPGSGLIAGIIFGFTQMVAAGLAGSAAILPLLLAASVVLGGRAFTIEALALVGTVGIFVHIALSGIFGLVYGLVNSRFARETRTSRSRQAILGLLYGAALWLVNFQVIARLLYPWFLDLPQVVQLGMHALFFGLPLALMYGGVERRAVRTGEDGIPRAA
jgi:hypothetical protein